MDRKIVKRVFFFFLVFLPFQYGLIGLAGLMGSEPWPAFALPGFKSVHTVQSQSEVISPLFYARSEETYREISASELFQGIQPSQLQGFIRKNFSQQQQYSEEVQRWLKERIHQIYPEVSVSALKIVWEKTVYERIGDQLQIDSVENEKVITISFTE